MPDTILKTPKNGNGKANGEPTVLSSPLTLKQLGLSMNPLSPVQLTGDKSLFAYLRLIIYGGLTYMTWSNVALRYTFMGATAVSLASSLSAGAWYKEIENAVNANAKVTTQV